MILRPSRNVFGFFIFFELIMVILLIVTFSSGGESLRHPLVLRYFILFFIILIAVGFIFGSMFIYKIVGDQIIKQNWFTGKEWHNCLAEIQNIKYSLRKTRFLAIPEILIQFKGNKVWRINRTSVRKSDFVPFGLMLIQSLEDSEKYRSLENLLKEMK